MGMFKNRFSIRFRVIALVCAAIIAIACDDPGNPGTGGKVKLVSVRFQVLFESRTMPSGIHGQYDFGDGARKFESTSGVVDKTESVPANSYVSLWAEPKRTDAFGNITCRITSGKTTIDTGKNDGKGRAECAGQAPSK